MCSNIKDLIDDVLIHLFIMLPVPDLINLRKTCKRLSFLTKLRTIWCCKFQTEVVQRKLPIPGSYLPYRDLPADDLEWRTRRALILQHKWDRRSRQTALSTALPLPDGAKQVVLLPGGQHVLTVHASCMNLWRVGLPSLSRNATVEQSQVWKASELITQVIRDAEHPDCIAVETLTEGQTTITVICVYADGSFVEAGTFHTSRSGQLVGLLGDFVVLNSSAFEDPDDVVILVNWKSNKKLHLQTPFKAGKYLTYTLFQSHLVILLENALVLFPLFPFSATLPRSSTSIESDECTLGYTQVFWLRQQAQQPVSMSSCRPHTLPEFPYTPTHPDHMPENDLTCLSIMSSTSIQHPWGPQTGICRSVLHLNPTDDNKNSYSLSQVPMSIQFEDCSDICIGPSGRGVWNDNGSLRPCTPRTMITSLGEMKIVDLNDQCRPLCRVLSKDSVDGQLSLDFDDGMGRIAVAHGKEVKVIDLV